MLGPIGKSEATSTSIIEIHSNFCCSSPGGKCFKGRSPYGGNKEALAWAVDTTGRAVAFIAAGAFLAPTLLRLAKEAAGCDTEPGPDGTVPDCEGRVYGIRPSSLLTTYTIVVGISSAVLMPLMGSLIDHTLHRRLMGRLFALLYCLFMFPQVFIGPKTWFMVTILQIIVSFIGWLHTTLAYAYLPELTSDEDQLNKYTSNFTMVNFGSMVLLLALVVGISFATGINDDDVLTARLGMSFGFVITSLSFTYSWITFQKRPAARELPSGASIWTEGFKQIVRTSLIICRDYKALMWFYIATSSGEAAISSLATISVTYLTDVLQFSSIENGIALFILLVSSIPGGFLSGWYVSRYKNAIRSSIFSTSIIIFNTTLASIILTGPGQQARAYGIACLWGFGVGWKWASDKLMASTLIPGGQDAELMGLYLFAGQSMVWLPPLIYTGLNEAGINQRINIAVLNTYLIVAVAAYFCMGNYQDALNLAKSTKEQEGIHVISTEKEDPLQQPIPLTESIKMLEQMGGDEKRAST